MSFSVHSMKSYLSKGKVWTKISKLPWWKKLLPVGVALILLSLNFIPRETQSPASSTDPFALGEYYFNSNNEVDGHYDLKLARQYYTQAIEEGSEEELVWYQLGRIDFLEGKFDAAIFKFEKQISLHGDAVPNVYYMKGLVYGYKARKSGEEKDWQAAEENFTKFINYSPESPWTRTDLSWVYFSQGKFAEMLPVLEGGLLYEPYNPWLLNMHGLALLNMGHKKEAREQFLQAKEYASYLEPEEWGRIYPGNDPDAWEQGVVEFQSLIEKNLNLTSE